MAKNVAVLVLLALTLSLAACTEVTDPGAGSPQAGAPAADPATASTALGDGDATAPPGAVEQLPEITYAAEGGLNEGFSRFPSGPQSGLWAGNVETVPERPAALPDSFWQEPAETKAYPGELDIADGAKIVFRDPATVPAPLWVFADEVEKARLDALVEEGVARGRVVVVFGRDYRHMVGPVAPPPPFGQVDVADFGIALAWAPWEERVPHANTTFYVAPAGLEQTNREAVYALMAFETVADEVE